MKTTPSKVINCNSTCERCESGPTRHSNIAPKKNSRPRGHRTANVPLNKVMSYRFEPLINRLVEKKSLERMDAETLYVDMLRFLYLCGTDGKVLAPSERIDLAWHEFLLFTREYQRFCRSMFGFFVHHNPVESGKRPVTTASESPVSNTLTAARKVFGGLSKNWRYPGMKGAFCSGYNCAKCSTPSTNCNGGGD